MKIRNHKKGWYSYINGWFKSGKAEYPDAKISVFQDKNKLKGQIHFELDMEDLIEQAEKGNETK